MAVEEPSDEMLMRLADGELAPADAEMLRGRIAADPALAARFEIFARTRRAAASVFAPILAEPVPERLLAAIRAADGEARAPRQAAAPPMPQRRPPRRFLPLALAASVAALLAAPVGYVIGRDGAREATLGDPLAGARALIADTLEGTASGARRGDGARGVRPLATHVTPGGVCRDFALDSAAGAVLGVACRDRGVWSLRAAVALGEGDAIRAAAPDHPVIAAALERLGAEPPLDAESEAAMMRRGWR